VAHARQEIGLGGVGFFFLLGAETKVFIQISHPGKVEGHENGKHQQDGGKEVEVRIGVGIRRER